MTAPAAHRWEARPVLATALRVLLLAVPLVASTAAAFAVARGLPPGAATSWWGVVTLLLASLVVGVVVERGARRLLPIALLLQLSLIFPDRAPSRFHLARAAAVRQPRNELLWNGSGATPISTTDLVLALVSALGTHDRRTRGHSERVRLLCDMLAVELNLDDQARDRLRWSSLLHDVGKVEVSARILNKPGPLTDAEFDAVRLHPAAGAVLAAPLLPWLGTWGDGILDHHERYDGTGYPNGKAGDEISAAGRLIGLIDAFETMTATRSYKKAVAARAARAELARCAGSHFDPVYVRAFLAISLPRLMWAMGPVSFLLQLPLLPQLVQTAARVGVSAPQAAGGLAAGAAGAAVLVTGSAHPTTMQAFAVTDERGAASSTSQAEDGPGRPELGHRAPLAAALAPGSTVAKPTSVGTTITTPKTPSSARPAPGKPVPARAPAPAPAPSRGAARAPAPAAAPAADDEHTAILAGPPTTTTSRRATFDFAEVAGVTWECQLSGAADGTSSRWKPCADRLTVTVVRDGDHVLRVRNADGRDEVDVWEWRVLEG